jgi:RHS repeat-associated protein
MKKLIALTFITFAFHFAFAQTWTGPSSVQTGQVANYTFDNGIFYTTYSWSATDGMVTAQSFNGTTFSCTITWTTAGNGTVYFSGGGTQRGTLSVLVSCPVLTTPNATFSYPNGTSVCGSGTITYTGAPPMGVTWYWQTSSTGTSTSNSSNSFSVTTSGTYYLRATCQGTWGSAESTSAVTVNTIPTVTGSSPTICSGTGAGILLTNNVPNTTNTWTVPGNSLSASNSSGVSGASSPYTYNLNQTLANTTNANASVTYTITPSANGCTGSSITATATVKPIPTISSATVSPVSQVICSGSSASITLNTNSVSSATYAWTVTPSGNVTGASNPGSTTTTSQTLSNTSSTSGSVSYSILPAANGCTGSPFGVTIGVNPFPIISLNNYSPTVCSSSTNISFSSVVSGTTFTWGVSSPNVDGASPQATPVSAGTISQSLSSHDGVTPGSATYNLVSSATFANGGTCTSAAITSVTVNPKPVATLLSKTFFVGSSISVPLASTIAGSTYSYSVTASTNITGSGSGTNNPLVQPLTLIDGTAWGSVTYSVTPTAGGCTGTAANTVVNLYPQPVITSSSPNVYVGSSATLSAKSFYDSYNWAGSSGAITGGSSVSITKPDTYTVNVVKSGVTSNNASITIVTQFSGQNLNYFIANSLQVATSDTSRIKLMIADSVQQGVQYFDGHGRLTQTVSTQGSPAKADMVSAVAYDAYGRKNKNYLPFTNGNNGWYKVDPLGIISGSYTTSAQYNFYNSGGTGKIANDTRPFSETIFESSDLNRHVKDYGPGIAWNNTNVTPTPPTIYDKYVYSQALVSNSASESIIAWDVSTGMPLRSTASNTSISGGFYTTGQLHNKSTKDEQGHEVREYVDRIGHTILKKVQLVDNAVLTDPTQWTQTYYIYDDWGLLRYVFQPELTKYIVQQGGSYNPTSANLAGMAFQYKYDGRNRMVQKKVPGTGWVYMVYDNHDRLVLTQDSVQRTNNQWLATKYDSINRPVMTAIYSPGSNITLTAMNGMISKTKFCEYYGGTAFPSNYGYSSNVFPTTNLTVLTVTYYDSYNFITDLSHLSPAANYTYLNTEIGVDNTNNIAAQITSNNTVVLGHPTGGVVNVLGTTKYLTSVAYYDNKFRTIQTTADNNKGGTDRTTNVVDFLGRVLKTKTTHKTSTHGDQTIVRRLVYDHMSRMKQVYHALNGEPEILIEQNSYNEIGQEVQKNLHCTNCGDPAIAQGTTSLGGSMTRSSYNNTEQTLLATQSIYMEPGYYVPNGNLVDARIVSSYASIPGGGSGGTYLQTVDYRYNIRGWLQSMNNSQLTSDGGVTNSDTNDLFGFELAYNTAFTTGTTTGNTLFYNGNISAMKWSSNMALGTTKDVAYNYSYDAINRITGASYLNNNAGTWANATGQFNESGYSYDQNGNITALTRKSSSGTTMDGLTYTYTSLSNQLQAVADAGDPTKGFVDGNTNGNDYVYDGNGNMATDKNKSLTAGNAIQYNYINLPMIVTKSTNEKIVYTYDAGGRKLTQQVYNASGSVTKTTEYDGEFIYQGDTLQFVNHEEGRVVMKGVTPEYQYHLKDHLGNVRLTFTSKILARQFTAGFETANQTTEASNFLNYPSGSHINTVAANAHTGTNSLYLNGGVSGQVGVAKSFSVMPGDVVNIQAYAKYNTPSTTATNFTPFISSLLGAFNLTPPAPGEVGTPAAGVNSFGNWEMGATGDESKNDAMKIFVTIIMFDRNYNFLDVAYQAIQGSGVMNATYKAKQPGYAYLYVSNEHPYLTDVYFDDVAVTFTPSPVVQQEDFYPFGLSFNSYSRENSVPDNYLFNEMELQKDLSLNWYDYGARQYDPAIGRFLSIDPHADNDRRWSPYVYAYDNPIRFIDPDGMDAEDNRPRGATVMEGDHTDREITVTRSGEDGNTSHTITETNTTTNGSYQFDDDGNAVGWKETKTTTTSQTVLNENGDKVSSSQKTSTSENTYALNKGTQLSLFGDNKTVYSLGSKISGSSQTTTSSKISNASNEFKNVVSMTGDYSRMTNGLSITQTNTNWMMQSLSRNPTDSGLSDERSMAALALPALFESSRTQTFYKSCGKSLLECKIHNDYLKAIRTGTAGYIKTK